MGEDPGWAVPGGEPTAPAPPPAFESSWGTPQPPPSFPPPPGAAGPASLWGRPKPGVIPLRPIGLGEIYDGAFQAIRTNPRTMIGISAIVVAATTLLTVLPQAAALTGITALADSPLLDPQANRAEVTPSDVAGLVGGALSAFVLPAIVQWLAITVLSGLLIVAVSAAVLGRKTPPRALWERTRRRVPALIGLSVLVPLAIAAMLLVLVVPGLAVLAGGWQGAGIVLLVLGCVAWVPLGVHRYILWSMSAPALLLEDQRIVASLRRSAIVVRGSFWRVFGILLLTSVVVGILGGLITAPFSAVGALISFTSGGDHAGFGSHVAQLAIAGIGTILSGAVLYPFSAAVTALLYVDLRMRREGLDVELMRAAEHDAWSPPQ